MDGEIVSAAEDDENITFRAPHNEGCVLWIITVRKWGNRKHNNRFIMGTQNIIITNQGHNTKIIIPKQDINKSMSCSALFIIVCLCYKKNKSSKERQIKIETYNYGRTNKKYWQQNQVFLSSPTLASLQDVFVKLLCRKNLDEKFLAANSKFSFGWLINSMCKGPQECSDLLSPTDQSEVRSRPGLMMIWIEDIRSESVHD